MAVDLLVLNLLFFYLAVNKGSYGQVPGRIGGHPKAQKRPNAVVVKGGYENCGCAASSKNIGPCPLVQFVIDVVNITVIKQVKTMVKKKEKRMKLSFRFCLNLVLNQKDRY